MYTKDATSSAQYFKTRFVVVITADPKNTFMRAVSCFVGIVDVEFTDKNNVSTYLLNVNLLNSVAVEHDLLQKICRYFGFASVCFSKQTFVTVVLASTNFTFGKYEENVSLVYALLWKCIY